MKMQRIDAWMCHHPVDEEATLDDLGRSRCPRCGWRITRVLTKKALDRAIEQMSRAGWS
jgi:DNA-directed RNA polymerase subunit RPC12/RpoP